MSTTPAIIGEIGPRPAQGALGRLQHYLLKEATFFRLHVVAFTFVPLVCSGIFYACNGQYPVSYLDSLFLCYSAMTVCGLSTINLSTTTAWQQVMLYMLMTLVSLFQPYKLRRCSL